MHGINATQLAELAGLSLNRFNVNLHRARTAFAAGADASDLRAASDAAAGFLPFRDGKVIDARECARYGAEHVLALALAVEAEKAGMGWREACETVVRSKAAAVALLWPLHADVRMVRVDYGDGHTVFSTTTWSAILQRWAQGERPARVTMIGASDILRKIRDRADAAGVADALGFEARGFE